MKRDIGFVTMGEMVARTHRPQELDASMSERNASQASTTLFCINQLAEKLTHVCSDP